MKGKIVIAGATGFIGRYFCRRFREDGYPVYVISRDTEHISWDDEKAVTEALNGSHMLINLAGKSVNCRYTAKNRALILRSRVDTTRKLFLSAQKCSQPPALWINSSTATIYRHAEDRPMTEKEGEIGFGFSVEVAQAWESSFFENSLPGMRQVALRTAITLGKDGGVMSPYVNMVKWGIGGRQGSGRQMFSWIHIEDLYQVVKFIDKNSDMEGIYNCAAPNPVTNKAFMRSLQHGIRPLFSLPSPAWLLKAGAVLIQTETELILKSRWVLPQRLQEKGYIFRYPDIDSALRDILPGKR